jgi:ParB-like chromosome segregation protein Spo0J
MLEELIDEDGYDRDNIKNKLNDIKEYISNII